MSGPMQDVTDRHHSRRSSTKEGHLASRPALAKRSRHRIHFLTAIAQIMVSNPEVRCLQRGMAEKQRLVSRIQESVPGVELIQLLGRRHSA